MDSHKKILGILFLVLASFQTLAMLVLSMLMSVIFSYALSQSEPADVEVLEFILRLVRYIPMFVIIFLAVPGFIAGIGLLARQGWAMVFSLIIGCLHILSFPLGTALGIYTIWVYTEEQRLLKQNPAAQ